MKLIITGAAGYLGAVLTLRAAGRGHDVVAVDSDRGRLGRLAQANPYSDRIRLVPLNVSDLIADRALMSWADTVVHLAGISSDSDAERDPVYTYLVNVDLTIELARAAKAAGVGTFVLASTAAIYQVPVGHRLEHELLGEAEVPPLGQPIGVYAQSKLEAEEGVRCLADSSFATISLRKGSLYGYSPIMRWDLILNRVVLKAWRGECVLLHDLGAVWRPIVHVSDAARAYLHLVEMRSITGGWHSFNLVDRNVRLSEACLEIDLILREELGHGFSIEHGTSPRPQRTGRISGEALRGIGWEPERSLQDGIRELLSYLRTAGSEVESLPPSPGSPRSRQDATFVISG
jgi:nucleoside-diphosphate-sugar epimerase